MDLERQFRPAPRYLSRVSWNSSRTSTVPGRILAVSEVHLHFSGAAVARAAAIDRVAAASPALEAVEPFLFYTSGEALALRRSADTARRVTIVTLS